MYLNRYLYFLLFKFCVLFFLSYISYALSFSTSYLTNLTFMINEKWVGQDDVEWVRLAQERDQWLALISRVLKRSVPYYADNSWPAPDLWLLKVSAQWSQLILHSEY